MTQKDATTKITRQAVVLERESRSITLARHADGVYSIAVEDPHTVAVVAFDESELDRLVAAAAEIRS